MAPRRSGSRIGMVAATAAVALIWVPALAGSAATQPASFEGFSDLLTPKHARAVEARVEPRTSEDDDTPMVAPLPPAIYTGSATLLGGAILRLIRKRRLG